MKKIALIFSLICGIVTGVIAQDNPITVKPYGYISYEIIYDTYRSLDSRDGELYFFPKKPVFDANGNDINKHPKLNMITVQSRFGFNISGNEIFGAKTSGRIEADFFGTQQDLVRMLRLRLAFISLKWENAELMMGHHFHPTFVLDCFPGTITFAAAMPFNPLNRSPQIRLTKNLTNTFTASLSFLMHGYHSSAGPSDQQRNSGLPDSQIQLRFNPGNFLFGVTAGYKFLSPRDVTATGINTNKTVGSYNLQGFTKITTNPITLKAQAIYGENLSNFIMIGGYGAKGTDDENSPFDWNSDYDYANSNTISLWADLQTNATPWQIGLFVGYTENLGSSDPFLTIPGSSLFRFADLHTVFRVSPRVIYAVKNLSFGFEYSFYNAVYAASFDEFRKPLTFVDPAINHHILVSSKYTF